MAKSIGELSVVVGAEVSEFKRGMAEMQAGLKDANKQVGQVERDFKKSFGNIEKQARQLGIAMAAIGGGIVAGFVKAGSDYGKLGEELLNLQTQTGLSVKTLSELKYMAEQSGGSLSDVEAASKGLSNALQNAGQSEIDLAAKIAKTKSEGEKKLAEMKKEGATADELTKAQKDLGEKLAEMAEGSQTATRAFEQLGLSIERLQALRPEQRFWAVSQALAGVADANTRAALAQDAFGRSGMNLLPMLAQGTAAIQAQREEAEKLGVTMTDSQAKAAAAFDDSMDKMKASALGLKNAFAEAVLPTLKDFIDKITTVITKVADWVKTHENLVRGILIAGGVIAAIGGLLLVLSQVSKAIIAINTALIIMQSLSGPVGWGILAASAGIAAGALLAMNAVMKDTGVQLDTVQDVANRWQPGSHVPVVPSAGLAAPASAAGGGTAPAQESGAARGTPGNPFATVDEMLKAVHEDVLNGVRGYASGAIVRSPTLAMVGERGPEAVVPLPDITPGGGGGTINQYFNIGALTDERMMREFARTIKDLLAREQRRSVFPQLGDNRYWSST